MTVIIIIFSIIIFLFLWGTLSNCFHGLLLVMLTEPCVVSGIEAGQAACKARASIIAQAPGE